MRKMHLLFFCLVASTPAFGQPAAIPTETQASNASGAPSAPISTSLEGEFGVPVFPFDITDRPYEVIGEVEAGVRKATVFSKSPSQEKIYKELWERAKKRGADAVIKAQYGNAHVTAMSWGKTNATGVAIRFISKNAASAAPAVE